MTTSAGFFKRQYHPCWVIFKAQDVQFWPLFLVSGLIKQRNGAKDCTSVLEPSWPPVNNGPDEPQGTAGSLVAALGMQVIRVIFNCAGICVCTLRTVINAAAGGGLSYQEVPQIGRSSSTQSD